MLGIVPIKKITFRKEIGSNTSSLTGSAQLLSRLWDSEGSDDMSRSIPLQDSTYVLHRGNATSNVTRPDIFPVASDRPHDMSYRTTTYATTRRVRTAADTHHRLHPTRQHGRGKWSLTS